MPTTSLEQQRTRTATHSPDEPSLLSSSPAPTPESIGPFRIDGVLGEGGMGTVYSALDTRHGTRVAIKTLPRSIDEVRLRALKREFRLMGEFSHRNVVEMYDLRAEQSSWYIVMELVEGAEFVASTRAMGWSDGRGLEAVRQLTLGLHALHQTGWLHRDLKSSNVFIEARTGRTVMLDFGLAETLSGMANRERRVLGTPSHMAPELLDGSPATIASDWYAVGVMLCVSILGELPRAPERSAFLRRVASERLGVERLLLALSAELMQHDAQLRPASAEIFSRLELAVPEPSSTSSSLEGRERELSLLETSLAATVDGKIAGAIVEGAAGLGKTSLVNHFLDRLERSESAHVFRSRCYVNEHIPFKAVDRLVEMLAVKAVREATGGSPASERSLPRVSELFPALSNLPGIAKTAPPDTSVPPAQRRNEAFGELRGLLAELRSNRPVVIFIDDAHYGDADSVSLLRALLDEQHDSAAHGVLMLWSQRPGLEHSAFLSEAARAPICRDATTAKIELEPLDRVAAARVARFFLPKAAEEEVLAIVNEVDGSPLLLTKAGKSGAQRAVRSGSFLQGLVDADLESASAPVRRLLGIVAVASTPIAMDVAFRAAGSDYDAYRALATLRQANLVNVTSDASAFQGEDCLELYHDQLRELVLSRTDEARSGLHRDLARSLEGSQRRHAGLLSVHFHAAGELEPAARYAEQAADEAEAALAFAATAGHLQSALAWGTPTTDQRIRLQTRMAEAFFNAGDCVAAAKAYHVARSDAPPLVSRELAVKQASSWFSAGHVEEGINAIRPLLKGFGISLPSKALLMPTIAVKVFRLRWRGLELPKASQKLDADRVFRADACWSMGCGLSIFLSMQGSYFIMQSLLESIPLGDGRRIGRGLAFVGGVCVNLPKMGVWGNACLSKAEELAATYGDAYLLGWCNVWRANAELVAGRFSNATNLAETAIQLIEQGPYAMTWECHTARCFSLMAKERRGDLLDVEREADQVFRQASLNDDLYGRVVFALFSAQVAVAKGDIERARLLAREAMTRWTKDNFTIQHFYALRVETYCDLYEGKLESARARVLENWKTIQSSDVAIVPSAKMESQLLRAQVELSLASLPGSDRKAYLKNVQSLSDAIERACPEGRGFAQLLRGCAGMVRGETALAASQASLAAETFAGLGMRLWANVARRSEQAANQDAARLAEEEASMSAFGVREAGRWLATMTPGFA